MREKFLHDVPSGLKPEALARWRYVWNTFELDEAQYMLFDVERDPGGCTLMRQLWCFDEEGLEWELECNDEWWLPLDVSEAVLQALMEAMTVGEAK